MFNMDTHPRIGECKDFNVRRNLSVIGKTVLSMYIGICILFEVLYLLLSFID